jgi:hypothetical protein
MFEQEIEMEQRQSSVVPLLLIIAMILAFVGVAAYYVIQNQKTLPAAEAALLIEQSLKADGPATIHFESGKVVASVQERPQDANYRLFEKAGLLKLGEDNGHFTPVELTAAGRKLVGTPKVTMTGMGRATAEFTWAWEPNKMGELLDASGPLVKSFSTWDRATLIDKYGAKFYHGEPNKVTTAFVRGDKGWQIAPPQ